MLGGAALKASIAARLRPTCSRSPVRTPMVASRMTTAQKMAAKPTANARSATSDLHVHDLLHPEASDDAEYDAGSDHEPPKWLLGQREDVRGPRGQQIEREHNRKTTQDPGGESTFSREGQDLTPKPSTFSQCRSDREKELREVAADITLDADGHHDPGPVL